MEYMEQNRVSRALKSLCDIAVAEVLIPYVPNKENPSRASLIASSQRSRKRSRNCIVASNKDNTNDTVTQNAIS